MSKNLIRVVTTALLLTKIGAVCQAAPIFHSSLISAVKAIQSEAKSEDDDQTPYQWMLPSIIQAGTVQKDIGLVIGDSFASFQGRSFNEKQGQFTAGVTDKLQLFYGKQYFLAKGRSTSSRFDVADEYYGFRYVVKPPKADDPTAFSVQFQAIKPDTASITSGGSRVDFPGTHNNVFAVNYLDRREDQIQFQFTNITINDGSYAHVYSLGLGHDYELGNFLKARAQGSLVGENFRGDGIYSNFELRPVVFGGVSLVPAPWLSFEADLTVMPSGIPLAGGEFTGLSGFALYNPGGIVDSLRSDFVAFGSVRLLFHGKF